MSDELTGLLGTVIIGGIAYKVADKMLNTKPVKKISKKAQQNAYTRERAVFGKHSPF